MRREVLEEAIAALEAGEVPVITPEDVPAFAEAAEGGSLVGPDHLAEIVAGLTADDIPTLERAVRAMDADEQAWLGFKVVFDPAAAVAKSGSGFTKDYGETGSADGRPLVFFCNDAKEIVSSREPSKRDVFQMKDATRGPSMHTDQFDGLTWVSVALFDPIRVWLLGASDASSELSALAAHVGFEVVAVDYDEDYLNERRFPDAERILLPGGNFDALADIPLSPADYVCVLTRGHMYDPESCIWAVRGNAAYVGMMGCAGKNGGVHDIVVGAGVSEGQWDSIKRPIGLDFGAKTPAELAVAIVAELIDIRYRARYSAEARARHDRSLGRD